MNKTSRSHRPSKKGEKFRLFFNGTAGRNLLESARKKSRSSNRLIGRSLPVCSAHRSDTGNQMSELEADHQRECSSRFLLPNRRLSADFARQNRLRQPSNNYNFLDQLERSAEGGSGSALEIERERRASVRKVASLL